jgi:hypothetical protein
MATTFSADSNRTVAISAKQDESVVWRDEKLTCRDENRSHRITFFPCCFLSSLVGGGGVVKARKVSTEHRHGSSTSLTLPNDLKSSFGDSKSGSGDSKSGFGGSKSGSGGSKSGSGDTWNYNMRAWPMQERGHVEVSGQCLGLESTDKWSDVIAFYERHKNADYCRITAARVVYFGTSKIETWQNVCLYVRCVGCDATDMPDWVVCGQPSYIKCLAPNLKPHLASQEEIAATEAKHATRETESNTNASAIARIRRTQALSVIPDHKSPDEPRRRKIIKKRRAPTSRRTLTLKPQPMSHSSSSFSPSYSPVSPSYSPSYSPVSPSYLPSDAALSQSYSPTSSSSSSYREHA